jgi:exosortase family protein XrtM
VIAAKNVLESASASLSVVRGCDGSGVIFLLIAAIIAYRANVRRTLLGVIGAVALVYVVNQMRIITLFFIDVHWPSWFTPMHVYAIPTLMILLGTLYFAFWAAFQDERTTAPQN